MKPVPRYLLPSARLTAAFAVQLILSTLFLAIQSANKDARDVGRWMFVVDAALYNVVVVAEAAFIAASLFSRAKSLHRWEPRSIFAAIMLILNIWLAGSHALLALAQFQPSRHVVGLPDNENVLVTAMRVAYTIGILMGPGGYGRYLPTSTGAEMIVAYAMVFRLLGFLLGVAAVIVRIAERYQNHPPKVKPCKLPNEIKEPLRKVVVRDGYTWVGYAVELGVLAVLNFAALGLAEIRSAPLVGPIFYAVFTVGAVLVLVVEVAVVVGDTFTSRELFQRRPLRWWSGLLLLLLFLWVYTMVFTAFGLFGPERFYSGISSNVDPFLLWLKMFYVAVIFLGPGGYGLEVARALVLELVTLPMVLGWVMAISLSIELIVRSAQSKTHSMLFSHKHGGPAEEESEPAQT